MIIERFLIGGIVEDSVGSEVQLAAPLICRQVRATGVDHSESDSPPSQANFRVYRVQLDDSDLATIEADTSTHLWNDNPQELADFLTANSVTQSQFEHEISTFKQTHPTFIAAMQAVAELL